VFHISQLHLHLLPRLMRGAIPPLPRTLSWRGAQLKHRDSFTVPFIVIMQASLALMLICCKVSQHKEF
jgi:hypothetical protein